VNLINLPGGGYWKTRLKARGRVVAHQVGHLFDGLIFARRIFYRFISKVFALNAWTWINDESFQASENAISLHFLLLANWQLRSLTLSFSSQSMN